VILRGKDSEDTAKPFVEHLSDLRQTLIRCAVALLLGILIAIPLAPWILEVLRIPVARAGRDPGEFLRILKVAGGLSLVIRVVFWSGMLISAPGVVWAIAEFVFPGLTAREKMAVRRGAAFAVCLFVAGVLLCYFMTVPVAIRMMLAINTWIGETTEFVDLTDYVGFVLKLLLAFGLAFQLPVVLLALGSVGILTSDQLRDKRRHTIVGILVAAMLLTPPDPVTQLMMAVPLVLLYEVCIWGIRAMELRRGRETE
jgi:sec-independent protein translocase protein TatC